VTIAFRINGAHTSATTAVTALNPSTGAGILPTDISILVVDVKGATAGVAPAITTPSGWTLIGVSNNGTLVAGTDTGSNTIGLYYKVGAAASTAIGVITITGGNTGGAVIDTYSTTLGSWDVTSTTDASDTTSGANSTLTGVAGLAIAAGDWLFAAAGVSGDIGTLSASSFSAMSGATLGSSVNRHNFAVTSSTDCRDVITDIPVTAGSSSAVPVFNLTNTSSTTSQARFVRLREVASGPVTLAASGTVPVVATATGDATRVPLVLAASGTADVVSAASGDATRIGQTFTATGTIAVIATTSGDATRTPLAASGTIAATTAVTGDATRVPLALAASGTAAAIVAVTGNPTRVGLVLAASGTIAATTATSGDASRVPLILAATGTVPVVSSTSGNPTRVLLTLTVSGTIPAITGTSGNPTITAPGGATLAASGTVAAIAATNGDASRVPLVLAVTGQVTVTSTASGDVTRVVLVLAASGAVVALSATSGDVTRVALTLAASGTVDAVSVVIGAVTWVGVFPLVADPRLTLTQPTSALTLTVP
jgi:hypothetical protein